MRDRTKSVRSQSLVLFAGVFVGVLHARSLQAQVHSAAICTESYASTGAGPWLEQIFGATTGCKNFVNTMNTVGASDFFFSTTLGEHHALETQSGVWEDLVESEDILFFTGHSGAWSAHGANLSGFKFNDRAYGENMLLGNEGRRLSILAMWGCMVLEPNQISSGAEIIVNTANGPLDTGVKSIDACSSARGTRMKSATLRMPASSRTSAPTSRLT